MESSVAKRSAGEVLGHAATVGTRDGDSDLLAGLDWELPGDKQELVIRLFGEAAPLVAQLNAELYKRDRGQFRELVERARRNMLMIEPHLVALEERVKSEYVSLPVSLRLWLWLFSFLSSRARRDRLIWAKRRQRRSALLLAVRGYHNLLAQWRKQVSEAEASTVKQRQMLLLGRDKQYQQLLEEIRKMQEVYDSYSRNKDYYRLRRLRQEKREAENRALQEAVAELGDEI